MNPYYSPNSSIYTQTCRSWWAWYPRVVVSFGIIESWSVVKRWWVNMWRSQDGAADVNKRTAW